MKIYMKVTNDEFELPIAIADSPGELAKMLEVKGQSVNKAFYDLRHGNVKRTRYREVEIDDD